MEKVRSSHDSETTNAPQIPSAVCTALKSERVVIVGIALGLGRFCILHFDKALLCEEEKGFDGNR